MKINEAHDVHRHGLGALPNISAAGKQPTSDTLDFAEPLAVGLRYTF